MSDRPTVTTDASQEIRIPAESLRSTLEQILIKKGMFRFDAVVVAARVVESDLYGIPTHGCARFRDLLQAFDDGDADPRGKVLTTIDAPAFAVLNGGRALGQVAATQGAELAVAKAREQGAGIVAIGNSQTLGAAAVYVRMMAQEGVIGFCCSSTGGATVSAPGTHSGAIANHPFAYAIPMENAPPVAFDAACGNASWGRLELLQRYGLPIPTELLAETNGGRSIMQPAGAAFGFGIALFCSVLAGPLSGGRMPIHKKRRPAAEDAEHFFLAIQPEKFCNLSEFQKEVASSLAEIRDLPPIDPSRPVRLPGDRGAECHKDFSAHGVSLHVTIADQIRELAAKAKVEAPW